MTTWYNQPIRTPSEARQLAARERWSRLAKPDASLGVLEELVIRLVGMQHEDEVLTIEPARAVFFLADHGVAIEGVSAVPQSMTASVLRDFSAGKTAASIMAHQLGIEYEVINVGTLHEMEALPRVRSARVGDGTANFLHGPAMTPQELTLSLNIGRDAVRRAVVGGMRLFIGGDMGVGSTTSSGAIVASMLGVAPDLVAGPGSGLDERGMAHKAEVIQRAVELHASFVRSPMEVLRYFGGFETAALCGAYLACGQEGVPIVVDGLTTLAAALVATHLQPRLKPWIIVAHRSAEPGQLPAIQALGNRPVLQLDMRMGLGTGAMALWPLLRLAVAIYREMGEATGKPDATGGKKSH